MTEIQTLHTLLRTMIHASNHQLTWNAQEVLRLKHEQGHALIRVLHDTVHDYCFKKDIGELSFIPPCFNVYGLLQTAAYYPLLAPDQSI